MTDEIRSAVVSGLSPTRGFEGSDPGFGRAQDHGVQDYPYLYEGDAACCLRRQPRRHRRRGFDGARMGWATKVPMEDHAPECGAFAAKGYDIAEIFYFGESVSAIGDGDGHAFFDARERPKRRPPLASAPPSSVPMITWRGQAITAHSTRSQTRPCARAGVVASFAGRKSVPA